MQVPDPQPNKALEVQQKEAALSNIASMQTEAGQQTDLVTRLFGASNALAGSKMKGPTFA